MSSPRGTRMLSRRAKTALGLLIGAVAIGSVAGSTLASVMAQPSSEGTPEDIGAFFAPAYGVVRPARFHALKSRSEAEAAAIKVFLEHNGYPSGMGIDENLVVKSAQGLFSGAKGGFSKDGTWDIHNRNIWVVVLYDVPVTVPCGPRAESCEGQPPPSFAVAIDADTGEVLSTELLGNGHPSARWTPIIRRMQEARAAPTPSPYETGIMPTLPCTTSSGTAGHGLVKEGGPTPTPVPACPP